MERNLLKYIWMHSRSDQLWMLFIIILSMPTYFLSLELPKRIVNNPIQGEGFDRPGDTATFFQINMPFSESLFGEEVVLFSGIDLERISFLFALSMALFVLVIANGLFKVYINTYKGRMGERILRRLRYELFDRVLRYPLSRFRRTKASEIATMIKDEVEPMGEYIGDAFTQPLFLGGQAAVALLFIFLQHFWLGMATFVVVAFQAWLIPILRKRLIELQRQRQIAARKLAGRLGEVVEGIQDSHTHDTTNYQRSELSHILGKLFFIRFELYQRKFTVKFINNLLIQMLAIFFYAVGGYLAITGVLDIGQLLGVIVAYKDLPAPVRGLIDQDQKRLVVEVRYKQIIEQFSQDKLQEAHLQALPEGEVPNIETGYEINRLGVEDDTGSKLIEQASADIGVKEKIAVIGSFGGGAPAFAEVLAGVQIPTSGRVLLDGKPIEEQPEYLTGRRIAYIDGGTYFPQGSILDNLTFTLKNEPISLAERTSAELKKYEFESFEVKRSGNFELDFEAQWIDYNRIDVANDAELSERIREILIKIDLEEDIRGLGLRSTFDPEEYPELSSAILEARSRFRDQLDELGFSEFVEPFDPEKFNNQASIGENLLFGTAILPGYELDKLPGNILVRSVLDEEKLDQQFFNMGKEVAQTTLELFGDLDPDNPFFDQLTYMNADELPEYRQALSRIGEKPAEEVGEDDLIKIMRLTFSYIESQNRLGLLSEELKDKIVKARANLREKMLELSEMPVALYEPESYNSAASLIDNVLLGRVSNTVAEGQERVTSAIRNLLAEMELTDDVFRIGLTFNVGSGGKRLSEIQRQKLHLARALLKQPDLLIVNQGMNSLGGREQENIIKTVLELSNDNEKQSFGLIWVPMNAGFAELFDRVLIFQDGELVTDDNPKKIKDTNTLYKELVA